MTHPPAVSTASATPAGETPSPAKNPPPTPDRRPPTADHRPPTPGPRLLTPYSITLALLSGGGLMLEIALTRFFSTLFFPPYVFAVISIAILGLGLGAALATVRPAWRQLTHVTLYLTLAGYAVILLLLVAVWTASINLNGVLLALVLLPYLFIGLALATIFSAAPAASPRLYRADLLGAGVGAIGAIPVMNVLGGLNTLFLVSALFGLAALIVDYSANSAQRDRVLLSASEPEQPEQPPRRNRLAAWLLCGLAAVALITNTLPAT
ncbi:MAG: hypothetical protein KDJ97_22245, partial [Anaerolineae bacterium]|nr:hypothetical protein [Anaerolineae bacterium]